MIEAASQEYFAPRLAPGSKSFARREKVWFSDELETYGAGEDGAAEDSIAGAGEDGATEDSGAGVEEARGVVE